MERWQDVRKNDRNFGKQSWSEDSENSQWFWTLQDRDTSQLPFVHAPYGEAVRDAKSQGDEKLSTPLQVYNFYKTTSLPGQSQTGLPWTDRRQMSPSLHKFTYTSSYWPTCLQASEIVDKQWCLHLNNSASSCFLNFGWTSCCTPIIVPFIWFQISNISVQRRSAELVRTSSKEFLHWLHCCK